MTGELSYVLMNPSGNVTILVETDVHGEQYAGISSYLMQLEPAAEQVGFLKKTDGGCIDIGFEMAGGEFCGNASMSTAVYYASLNKINEGLITVKASGVSNPVKVYIKSLFDGTWQGQVQMPCFNKIEMIAFPEGHRFPVVSFDGISHVIIEKDFKKDEAERLIRKWCHYLTADALGIMFLNRQESKLTPLVYVPAAGTLFWESTCGSGTTAVGAYLAHEAHDDVKISLKQPGGTLRISALKDGSLLLEGTVKYMYSRTALYPPLSKQTD